MFSFGILLLCIHACLVQNAFGACLGAPVAPCGHGYGGAIAGPVGLAGTAGIPSAGAAYGGSGFGNIAIVGELPVTGIATLAGQVPIIGAVEFRGPVCAAGTVSITGSCGCGCGIGHGIY